MCRNRCQKKTKQIKSIKERTNRPILKSYKSKRSKWVIAFEEKYNKKITNLRWISQNIIEKEGSPIIF